MSPDDGEFERIYQSLPPGLVVVASGGEYFRLLQSFCFSLKGAAIRKGADAIHFNWNCSRENWDNTGGIQHFRDFIELRHSHGVRLFFIDASPQSGSLTHRTAELIRSAMVQRSIDQDIAELIQQETVSKNVTVIVTAIAEVVAQEQIHRAVRNFDSGIHEKQQLLKGLRDGISELERQFQAPNAEAVIAAFPKDIADQVRAAREALPGWALKMQEAEAQIAEFGQVKRGLKKKKSTTQLLTFLNTALYSGAWKGILLHQDRFDDDWYSAKVAPGVEVERYGPLDLLWECPQRPELAAPSVVHSELPTAVPGERRPSWLRRLFG
jgi:hypothetical protein